MKKHMKILLFFDVIVSIFHLSTLDEDHSIDVEAVDHALELLELNRSSVNWERSFGLLAERFVETESDLKSVKLLFAIISKIDGLWQHFRPDTDEPTSLTVLEWGTGYEGNCRKILRRTDYREVPKLISILERYEIDELSFCSKIENFYGETLGVNIPGLYRYGDEEMENILNSEYPDTDRLRTALALRDYYY
ncbi:uncharacterized protein LOC135845276 [Planococcus citri]|uniref:uncharacterized protein LOC135845276 n=1 Tax=Planococcus citri TaxID=170843 RepID=UPI0031F91E7E